MDILVTIDNPINLKNNILIKQCAFLKFDYDTEIIEFIKSLSIRFFDNKLKSWEIPINNLAEFVNKFTQHKIIIKGIYRNYVEKLVEIPKEYNFKTQPFNHQIEGIRFGMTRRKFLLGDDQGLGKTLQIINWSNIVTEKKVLIICGVNSLKYNWQNEIAQHSNQKGYVIGTKMRKNGNLYEGSSKDKLADLDNLPIDCKFIITNIETLRSNSYKEKNKTIFPICESINKLIKKGEIEAIAFDECHKAKSPSSLQGKALLKLQAPYMVAMSGTPLMNNPLDLFVPLKWLGYINQTYFAFKKHYCNLGGYGGQEVVGYKNLQEIRLMLDNVMIRRLKNDVLDLPEKIHTNDYVEMTSKQSILYKEVLIGIKSELHKAPFSDNPLAILTKLRQCTGYTGIISDKLKESAKLNRMEDLVEEITQNNQKVVIMSNYEMITNEVIQRLQTYKPALITGKIKADDRMNEVNRFQNEKNCKVIVGTIGAMGTGLTLTAGQTVIFLDEPWNRALKDQAEDRCYRIGTKGTVNIITIMCKNTIDEKIHDLVYKKGVISDMLIDGKGSKINMDIINDLIS